MRPRGAVQEKEMTAIVHYLRTWRRVTIRGQDVSDLLALVQQILSASGNPSTALSASTGSADGSDSWDRP
ncbi:hypothetical protein Acr_00g0020070 [Actinidia rufa]|uniref:Uncharacterized protein n=1 Tax=Actinidia rufa TaxID=165716 RepID=A0A7J0DCI0_9ERIC|nr:hypothetical protein Acr_00g0020070 [Actinidia rufa]